MSLGTNRSALYQNKYEPVRNHVIRKLPLITYPDSVLGRALKLNQCPREADQQLFADMNTEWSQYFPAQCLDLGYFLSLHNATWSASSEHDPLFPGTALQYSPRTATQTAHSKEPFTCGHRLRWGILWGSRAGYAAYGDIADWNPHLQLGS